MPESVMRAAILLGLIEHPECLDLDLGPIVSSVYRALNDPETLQKAETIMVGGDATMH
jgi:hypothetical protein